MRSAPAYTTPMIFGMISDRISTAAVNPAANRIMNSSPKRALACAPATDAPAVLATVFTIRTAAMGRSMLLLNDSSTRPDRLPPLARPRT